MRHRRARSATSSGHTAGRRPEIQGLRAIAALLVVLFHLWPGTFTGGYIGVDIFFVISCYLITAHLLREVDAHGRVRLAEFWARRARRLLPGAYLVLAATAIAIWLWVPQVRWPQFFREVIASTLYVENWSLASDAVDYLAESNAASPVQHYWTLSVEEQFYLGWPLLVLLAVFVAARLGVRRRIAIAAILGTTVVASLAYSLYLTSADPARAFFVTPTRAWEFGAGAMLALVPTRRFLRVAPWSRATASWCAIAVMVGAGFVLDDSTAMPGTAAIVVVAGAMLFLAAGGPTQWWAPSMVLHRRPVQFTGDISYALYLWHWPLIIVLPYALDRPNGNGTLVAILAATFVLATASTYLVEDPIRSARALRVRVPVVTLAFTVAGALVVVVPSAAVWRAQEQAEDRALAAAYDLSRNTPDCFGAASRDPEKPCSNPDLADLLVPAPQFAGQDLAARPECASRPAGETVQPCAEGDWEDPDVVKIALIGDSHARMYSTALTALADQGIVAYDGFFQSGCLWTADAPARTEFVDECNSFKDQLPGLLTDDPDRYDLVITTGRVAKLDGSSRQQIAGLVQAWSPVTDLGIPVVAIGDIPEVDEDINECLERAGSSATSICDQDRSSTLTTTDPLLMAAAQAPGGSTIDLSEFFCDASRCPAAIGGATVYANSNHLTATYVRSLAPMIARDLLRQGLIGP